MLVYYLVITISALTCLFSIEDYGVGVAKI